MPVVGSALGALAGWLTTEIGSVLFANCDGIVAASIRAFVSTDLLARTNNGDRIRDGVQHPGTTSATGCGANSQYATNTTISERTAIITPAFDLNGKYSAGGLPGPIIQLSGGNIITVDMSAYHRPNATGALITPTYGRIYLSRRQVRPEWNLRRRLRHRTEHHLVPAEQIDMPRRKDRDSCWHFASHHESEGERCPVVDGPSRAPQAWPWRWTRLVARRSRCAARSRPASAPRTTTAPACRFADPAEGGVCLTGVARP